MDKLPFLPELLAPAGSPRALEAAIDGGADAVYFGGSSFNARMGAKNFDRDAMREYVSLAHAYGVKCYVTLNTLLADRELHSALRFAAESLESGVDAFIVADLGLARVLKDAIPEIVLHASTQASGHNSYAARELSKLGFSRMVMAREATLTDIQRFTEENVMELEVFVHGALCVSHSGQCLFSSLVGGRSGNRGECAQPCRLPYGNGKYPLSLKDLCLAGHIPEFIDAGVASLKIEGRMKSPEYVCAVTKMYRQLLDERRAATREEIEYLSGVFSRDGFTDSYFKQSNLGHSMLGRRSEEDKSVSRTLPAFQGITRKVGVEVSAKVKAGEKASFSVSGMGKSVTVYGDEPEAAINAPMTREDYERSFTRLGATPYRAETFTLDFDEGLMLPVSKINALRREGIEAFINSGLEEKQSYDVNAAKAVKSTLFCGRLDSERTARFTRAEQVTDDCREFFDIQYLPLAEYDGSANGVIIPPVIFEREIEGVRRALKKVRSLGCEHALVGNLGHIALAKEFGFTLHGDFRLNVTNEKTLESLLELGLCDVILSPELNLARMRDIKGPVSSIVYGRIPLMLLEKCVIRELSPCTDRNEDCICHSTIVDRRGVKFPVLRESGSHRNTIYNSVPTSMSDRQDELDAYKITSRHFIFSTEMPDEIDRIIDLYLAKRPLNCDVRRIIK